jgi:uncharacterized sporulation protein YeaH/YhbH (DUF444 family)
VTLKAGEFKGHIESKWKGKEKDNLITALIRDKDDVYTAIKTFLGKGK